MLTRLSLDGLEQKTAEDQTPQRETASRIQVQAEWPGKLINQLLELPQSEAVKIQLRHRVIEFVALVQQQIDSKLPITQKSSLTVMLVPAEPPLTVATDPDRVDTEFDNPLANACKYFPRVGAIRIRISVDTTRQGAQESITEAASHWVIRPLPARRVQAPGHPRAFCWLRITRNRSALHAKSLRNTSRRRPFRTLSPNATARRRSGAVRRCSTRWQRHLTVPGRQTIERLSGRRSNVGAPPTRTSARPWPPGPLTF